MSRLFSLEVKPSYHYKPEDVECEYCVEWRHRRCQAVGCPWLAERIEAGVVSYASAVRELFWRTEDEAFIHRLGALVLHFRGSFWLDREHEFNTRLLLRSVGYGAWRDPRFFAALYLFGSNRALMKRSWNACLPSGFELGYMVMRGVSEHDYTLIQAAKAITGNASGLELEDLADTEAVDDTAFRLIVNALLIASYGADVLKLGSTEITY